MSEKKETPRPSAAGRTADTRYALYQLRTNKIVLIGLAISVVTLSIAAFSHILVNPAIADQQPLALRLCWNNPIINWHIANIKTCPSEYPLGTDAYGRNLLQMIILAIPIDLQIALEVVASAVSIGVVFGGLAAYAGGLIDEAILRITDIFLAVPSILLAIVLIVVLGRSLPTLTLAIIITWWPYYVRLMRSQVITEKEKPYVERLRASGAGATRILYIHIIRNSVYPILVQATLDIGSVILTVSALTFIGLTPNPLLPELGNLASQGIQYIFTAPWLILFPGLTILVISLGFNLLGDGIRDILDPRLRR
ncbi:MAG: ABC transporter permease [Nitrososphaerota archaeon]|jgi:peptide/nickel transport system permease protein|nr:ABC transporter permease [Nitrososphaerota archaeon]MDG6918233.1 ABC transporter permease [Nitrososphaerota archaeon]